MIFWRIRGDVRTVTVLYCVPQLYTVTSTHIWTVPYKFDLAALNWHLKACKVKGRGRRCVICGLLVINCFRSLHIAGVSKVRSASGVDNPAVMPAAAGPTSSLAVQRHDCCRWSHQNDHRPVLRGRRRRRTSKLCGGGVAVAASPGRGRRSADLQPRAGVGVIVPWPEHGAAT